MVFEYEDTVCEEPESCDQSTDNWSEKPVNVHRNSKKLKRQIEKGRRK